MKISRGAGCVGGRKDPACLLDLKPAPHDVCGASSSANTSHHHRPIDTRQLPPYKPTPQPTLLPHKPTHYHQRTDTPSTPLLQQLSKQTPSNQSTMPLVVPGLNSTGNKTEEWQNQLMGKKIGDASDHIVRGSPPKSLEGTQPASLPAVELTYHPPADLRQERPPRRPPHPQGGRHDDHGPQPRPVSLSSYSREYQPVRLTQTKQLERPRRRGRHRQQGHPRLIFSFFHLPTKKPIPPALSFDVFLPSSYDKHLPFHHHACTLDDPSRRTHQAVRQCTRKKLFSNHGFPVTVMMTHRACDVVKLMTLGVNVPSMGRSYCFCSL